MTHFHEPLPPISNYNVTINASSPALNTSGRFPSAAATKGPHTAEALSAAHNANTLLCSSDPGSLIFMDWKLRNAEGNNRLLTISTTASRSSAGFGMY